MLEYHHLVTLTNHQTFNSSKIIFDYTSFSRLLSSANCDFNYSIDTSYSKSVYGSSLSTIFYDYSYATAICFGISYIYIDYILLC